MSKTVRQCGECGAPALSGRSDCWSCGRPLAASAPVAPPAAAASIPMPPLVQCAHCGHTLAPYHPVCPKCGKGGYTNAPAPTALPAGWDLTVDPDGIAWLRRRRGFHPWWGREAAIGVLGLLMILWAAWLYGSWFTRWGGTPTSDLRYQYMHMRALMQAAFGLAMVGLSICAALRREEWWFGPNFLETYQQFFGLKRSRRYADSELATETWYSHRFGPRPTPPVWYRSRYRTDCLVLRPALSPGSGGTVLFGTESWSRQELTGLARLLAERTGWPLEEKLESAGIASLFFAGWGRGW